MGVNPEHVSLEDVWDHYEVTRDSLVRIQQRIKQSVVNGRMKTDTRFLGMNSDDIDRFFENKLDETDHQTCLFLIAAAEAILVDDFLNRACVRKRDDISRKFRSIFIKECEQNSKNVRLDPHILEIWRERDSKTKSRIGDFRGALNYRHWLAHGRHWVPKLGQPYGPSGIVIIISQLFKEIGLRTPKIMANPH
jgi:hypothetical protein